MDLIEAADIIAHLGWTRGTMKDEDGRVCLTGALRECAWQPGDWLIARAVLRRRGHGEEWNDAEGRTEDDVVGYLRTAPPVTDAEIADAFGPQWAEVVAIIRRAAVLTEPEVRSLVTAGGTARAAAWDAAREAAWEAARAAAWDAAWDAAGDAAWAAAREAAGDAAGDAAWAAAWGAAWTAAGAVSVRHLIGESFTQADYDTLVGPWRDVIGMP